MSNQLPLNILLRDDATLQSFFPGDNTEALSAISEFVSGKGESFLYFWGQNDVGKTHLLQAACQAANEAGQQALYFPIKENIHLGAELLDGIEGIPLICLDDIDQISGKKAWEEVVFHLFNRIKTAKGRLLISANVAPTMLAIHLPDLKSRLSWGVVYQLHRLSDEQKIEALQLRALQRGLHLSKTVGRFLLNRCSRSMSKLFLLLEALDKASLAEQRKLTVPFVKQTLKI